MVLPLVVIVGGLGLEIVGSDEIASHFCVFLKGGEVVDSPCVDE